MSTLSEGNEIEQRFYLLKAQEWACEMNEAEKKIIAALMPVRDAFWARRELRKLIRSELTQ